MAYTIKDHKLVGDNVSYQASPNHSGIINPEIIVMHHTGGWPDGKGSVAWLCNPQANASAHLVINHDGHTTQLVPFNVKAWHAGSATSSYRGRSPNGMSVGIELANPGRLVKVSDGKYAQDGNPGMVFRDDEYDIEWHESDWDKGYYINFSDKQKLSAIEIGRLLVQTYHMSDTTTHQRCDPTRKVDPHPGYADNAYRTAVLEDDHISPKPDIPGKHIVETERITVAYKWPSYATPETHFRPTRRLRVDRYGTYKNEVDGFIDESVWYAVGEGADVLWVNERDVRSQGAAGGRNVDLEA